MKNEREWIPKAAARMCVAYAKDAHSVGMKAVQIKKKNLPTPSVPVPPLSTTSTTTEKKENDVAAGVKTDAPAAPAAAKEEESVSVTTSNVVKVAVDIEGGASKAGEKGEDLKEERAQAADGSAATAAAATVSKKEKAPRTEGKESVSPLESSSGPPVDVGSSPDAEMHRDAYSLPIGLASEDETEGLDLEEAKE